MASGRATATIAWVISMSAREGAARRPFAAASARSAPGWGETGFSASCFALFAVVPDIGGELPLVSDLLPHHEIFAGDVLRRRAFGLQAESADLTHRGRAECLHVEDGDFRIAGFLRHALPHGGDAGPA